MPTFQDTQMEQLHFRKMQLNQYAHAYHVTVLCPMEETSASPMRDTITTAILENEEGADFMISQATGSAQGPVLNTGRYNWGATADQTTDFPMAGCNLFRASKGVSVRITNKNTGVRLTQAKQDPQAAATLQNNFMPFGVLFTPGYGGTFYKPVPFQYLLGKNERLVFEFRNRDVQNAVADLYHRVSICLIGHRMEG